MGKLMSLLIVSAVIASLVYGPYIYRASGAVQSVTIVPVSPMYVVDWDSFGCVDATEWDCIDDFGDGNTTYLSSDSILLENSITDALDIVLLGGGYINHTATLTLFVNARANSTFGFGDSAPIGISIQGESYSCGGLIFVNAVGSVSHRVPTLAFANYSITLPFPGYGVDGTDDCENANPDWTLSLVNRIRFDLKHFSSGGVAFTVTSVWAVLEWSTSLTYLADWGGSLCWLLVIVGTFVSMLLVIYYKRFRR